MPISKAKKEANRRWDEANRGRYWRATVVFPVEEKETVIDRAKSLDLTLSDYVRGLIERDIRGAK